MTLSRQGSRQGYTAVPQGRSQIFKPAFPTKLPLRALAGSLAIALALVGSAFWVSGPGPGLRRARHSPRPGALVLAEGRAGTATGSAAGSASGTASNATGIAPGNASNATKAAPTVKAVRIQPVARCGVFRNNVDYWTGAQLWAVPHISSADLCNEHCRWAQECGAWTWGIAPDMPGLTDVCFLKKLESGQLPEPRGKRGVVSGMVCRTQAGYLNVDGAVDSPEGGDGAGDDIHSVSVVPGAPELAESTSLHFGGTVYCFALMLPGSYEQDLLTMQYHKKASIFACDAYNVYSSQDIEIAPGVRALVVDSDLKCEKGGEFQTALNMDIFLAVWTKVISSGRFREHDWTVKVDPDCVFFPQRLHRILEKYEDRPSGIYLNNCKFGLHGPIEVFSRNAVQVWAFGSAQCVEHFHKLCQGPCWWGEDLFVDQCLWKVLGVERVDEWGLLTEDHCDPPPGWDCRDQARVSFHPFKTLDSYQECLGSERADSNTEPGAES